MTLSASIASFLGLRILCQSLVLKLKEYLKSSKERSWKVITFLQSFETGAGLGSGTQSTSIPSPISLSILGQRSRLRERLKSLLGIRVLTNFTFLGSSGKWLVSIFLKALYQRINLCFVFFSKSASSMDLI